MSTAPVVLLPAATEPAGRTSDPAAPWAAAGRAVLRPDLSPGPGAVVLEDAGLRVLAAVSGSGADRAVLCGSGFGAMVALHLAAHYPARVQAMVLTTANRVVQRGRRGVAGAVSALLPVSRVQQLGGGPARVLELLDQVRPVDYAGFVERVRVPALVVVGERDLGNLGPSRRLAALLPGAELAVAPGAGEGWPRDDPALLVRTAAAFLDRVAAGG